MNIFARGFLLVGAVLASAAPDSPAQTFQYEFEEIASLEGAFDDSLGYDSAPAFDVDGDGVVDILLSAPVFTNTGPGSVHLVSGAAIVAGNPAAGILKTWTGDANGDCFGYGLVCAGDMDLDGYPEIAIGASQYVASGPGYARIYAGKFLATGQGNEVLTTVQGQGSDCLGFQLAAGDTDNDGRPDLIVGAIHSGNARGSVEVISGLFLATGQGPRVLHRFDGTGNGDQWGYRIDTLDDLDGDGCTDFAVGSAWVGQEIGHVRVYSGLTGAELAFLGGAGVNTHWGWAVENLGDVNSDGFADLGIGSRAYSNGQVDVFSGKEIGAAQPPVNLYRLPGNQDDGQAYCAAAGDLDGDGVDDFAVGGGRSQVQGIGFVNIHSGATGGVIDTFVGEVAADAFSWGMNALGDLDGNGRSEFVVDAPGWDGNSGNPNDNRGKVYYYRGRCVGTATPYGSGLAGSGGFTPSLAAGTEPRVGSVWSMQLRDGLGGSLALLLTGLNQDALPAFGGTLHVKFDSTFRIFPCALPGSLPGEGDRDIPFNLPDTGLLDCVFGYAQIMVFDPAAPDNWAMSPGLAVVIGE